MHTVVGPPGGEPLADALHPPRGGVRRLPRRARPRPVDTKGANIDVVFVHCTCKKTSRLYVLCCVCY
jgi:hypothetical protein